MSTKKAKAPFRMFGGTVHSALLHAATEFDRKQARGRCYNPYALPQYMRRIGEVCDDIERGASPRAAILRGFSGRLLDAMLKAIGEKPHTRDEKRACEVFYSPATND